MPATPEPPWEPATLLDKLFYKSFDEGDERRCAACGRWLALPEEWGVLVGLDRLEVIHADCHRADRRTWELVN